MKISHVMMVIEDIAKYCNYKKNVICVTCKYEIHLCTLRIVDFTTLTMTMRYKHASLVVSHATAFTSQVVYAVTYRSCCYTTLLRVFNI